MKRKIVTERYPAEHNDPPEGFLGAPKINAVGCNGCDRCIQSCPVQALSIVGNGIELSLDICIFCGECARECPERIEMSKEYELASKEKSRLKVVFNNG